VSCTEVSAGHPLFDVMLIWLLVLSKKTRSKQCTRTGEELWQKRRIGLFKDSATADKVVAHLLKSGFSRDEVKLVRRSDLDGTRGPETDILKIGGLPQEHAGRYWEAVHGGECWLRSPRAAIRRIRQSASWARMGRLTSTCARLSRWRAAALASLRLSIQVSILKDRQRNSSRFHENLPAFLRVARQAIRAPGVVLVAGRSTRGSAKT
jgi:hypothetical protein